MADKVLGLWKAIVLEVDETGETGKESGRIKVGIPEIYGFKESVTGDKELIPSPWVTPAFSHPLDYFPVRKSDSVWIAFRNGSILYPIYVGFWIDEEIDETDPITFEETKLEAINPNVEDYTSDRILGNKDGSYLLFHGKENEEYVELGLLGKSVKFPTNISSSLKIKRDLGKTIVILKANDPSEVNTSFVELGEDYIQVEDSNNNVILMDATGILVEDTNGNTILFDSSGIDLNSGSNGAARLNDTTISNASVDSAFWSMWTAFFAVITGAPIPEPGLGAPSALQIALKAAIVAGGGTPSSLASKIDSASSSVVIG